MSDRERHQFLREHVRLSRRWFLKTAALTGSVLTIPQLKPLPGEQLEQSPTLAKAIADIEPYFTSQEEFRDVSRGKPKPHSLSPGKMSEVGLTRETWQLEVDVDPDKPAKIRNPLTRQNGNALDFPGLMQLAKNHAVRFPKVMTCLNIGCPLGMGIWEGVPLRKVIWQSQPLEDLRRVFYYGYHNDDPKQMFRSSLPVGRILEDAFGLPPVILCYKLNGQWLTPERGGPVRVVVPEAYGFKSIKWLTNIVLTNLAHANDTYENGNNDLDSHLKSFAATLTVPKTVKQGTPFAVTGYAQSGVSGVSRVQVWVEPVDDKLEDAGEHYEHAPWVDAEILKPPRRWGGGFSDDRLPAPTIGFAPDTGRPQTWPLKLAKLHWAVLLPGLPSGTYTLRSRTIDDNNAAQPMPRPFRKSGHSAIEQIRFRVEA